MIILLIDIMIAQTNTENLDNALCNKKKSFASNFHHNN